MPRALVSPKRYKRIDPGGSSRRNHAGRHAGRGQHHDRLDGAVNAVTDSERLETVDRAIADLEIERRAVVASEQKRVGYEWASSGSTSGGGGSARDHDDSRSR